MSSSAAIVNTNVRQPEFTNTKVSTASVDNIRWWEPIANRLRQLINLPRDWDSFGAPAIDPKNANTAIEILDFVMDDDTPLPELFPTSRGGVQLEWGHDNCFVEVEIASSTDIEVHFQQGSDTNPETILLERDTSRLRDIIAQVNVINAG